MMKPLSAGVRARLFFYNIFFPFVLAWMLPALALRLMRRGNYQRKFGQRFGVFDSKVRVRISSRKWTWIHSISVGETVLALKLARKMKERDPSLRVVLSVTTSTGFALAEQQHQQSAADWMEVIYNPIDIAPIVRRALDLVKPQRLIFIEAIWPNLLAQTKLCGAPMFLIARLSPRSAARFRRFRFLTGALFRLLDTICVQDRDDAARWLLLGAREAQIHVTGSIKYDHAPSPPSPRVEEFRALLRSLGVKENAPVLLAGSTFPGEERILAQVYRKLREKFPDLFLVIVPRHVERTDEAAADVLAAGLSFALRTAIASDSNAATPRSQPRADCLIVNTTGELRDWYHVATVVFIGKSLTSVGGQNPVEAVAAGKPVIFGPHMENFRGIVAQWLARDAAVQVADAVALKSEIESLLGESARRDALAARAREIAAAHEGATERVARLILKSAL